MAIKYIILTGFLNSYKQFLQIFKQESKLMKNYQEYSNIAIASPLLRHESKVHVSKISINLFKFLICLLAAIRDLRTNSHPKKCSAFPAKEKAEHLYHPDFCLPYRFDQEASYVC